MKVPAKKKRTLKQRGKGSQLNLVAKHKEKYRAYDASRREQDIAVRCPEGDSSDNGDICRMVPYLFSKNEGVHSLEFQQQISPEVHEFYLEHGFSNRYVEVRSGPNIANTGAQTEKALFSCSHISRGSWICPYVAEVYTERPDHGRYVMELARDLYLDPEEDLYDVGYLYYQDPAVTSCMPCPPNYARYINTTYPADASTGRYRFNCLFDPDDSGLDLV